MRRTASQLVPAVRANQIDGLVRQIAEASLPPARLRISNEALTMSAGELRGYLRARALFPVRDETRRIAAARQINDSVADELGERALERTVNLLLRELSEQPPLVIPFYEPRRRAAA